MIKLKNASTFLIFVFILVGWKDFFRVRKGVLVGIINLSFLWLIKIKKKIEIIFKFN